MDQSGIQRGYGNFTPLNPAVQIGYVYQNQFYDSEQVDQYYIQQLGGIPALFDSCTKTCQPLPQGSVQMYCYQGIYFPTYSHVEYYFNCLQNCMTMQSHKASDAYAQTDPVTPDPEPVKLIKNQTDLLRDPDTLDLNKKLDDLLPNVVKRKPLPVPGPGGKKLDDVKKICTICKTASSRYYPIFGKSCCLLCIRLKYINKELHSESKTGECNWTEGMIYDIHMYLQHYSSEEEKNDLPEAIPLPYDHVICIGYDKTVGPGYPAKGHIVGKDSICVEDACPNKDHVLCRACAVDTLNCPKCGEKVIYEETPPCPPECPNHNADFIKACETCGKVNPRIKSGKLQKPKAEEAKAEEKKE